MEGCAFSVSLEDTEPDMVHESKISFTRASANFFAGRHKYNKWSEKQRNLVTEEGVPSIQTLLNDKRLQQPSNFDETVAHIKYKEEIFQRMINFYKKDRFIRQKFHNKSRKKILVDQFIKEKFFGIDKDESMNHIKKLMKNKKYLLVVGDASWKNNNGLQFGAQLSSFNQILKRLREVIEIYHLNDRMHIVLMNEAYTTKTCSDCHECSMEAKLIEKTNKKGEKYIGRSRQYCCKECQFVCNRDCNAAKNIGLNVLYWSHNLAQSRCTWRFCNITLQQQTTISSSNSNREVTLVASALTNQGDIFGE